MADNEISPAFSPLSDAPELFDAPTPQFIGLNADDGDLDEMNLDSVTKPDNEPSASNNKILSLEMTQFDHDALNGVHGEEMRNLTSSYFKAKRQILGSQHSDIAAQKSSTKLSSPATAAHTTAAAIAANPHNSSTITVSTTALQPRVVDREDRIFGCL